jgi:hypothetical protein
VTKTCGTGVAVVSQLLVVWRDLLLSWWGLSCPLVASPTREQATVKPLDLSFEDTGTGT